MKDHSIRKFTPDDGSGIVDIFNHFVRNSFAAYPEKEVGADFPDRLRQTMIGESFYVVEGPDGGTVGFGFIRKHHAAEVFQRAAELTYFILPEHTRLGLGSRLLSILIEDARKAGVDTLLAQISSINEPSLSFHTKSGFTECGRFRRVGRKNGRDFDVVWMQKFI